LGVGKYLEYLLLQQIMSYSIITPPLKSILVEYIQVHPNVPNENHYQPLVTTSSDLLMDHSRNTIGMDLITLFIYLFIFPIVAH